MDSLKKQTTLFRALREHVRILVSDVRYGTRVLAATPGFTAVALAVMALGIGATTTISAS